MFSVCTDSSCYFQKVVSVSSNVHVVYVTFNVIIQAVSVPASVCTGS